MPFARQVFHVTPPQACKGEMPFAKTFRNITNKGRCKSIPTFAQILQTDMTLMTQRLTLIFGALPCCVYDAFFPRCPREMLFAFFPECLLQSFFVDDRSPEGGKQLAVRLFIQIYYDIL